MAKILTQDNGITKSVSFVPKVNGGFGQDVSAGLTEGHIAVVNGGAITIAPKINVVQIIISSLNTLGVWYPLEYVGPNYNNASAPSIAGFGGAGFCRVTADGTITNFKWTQSGTAGVSVPIDLYISQNGNPFGFSYTGITLNMQPNEYITEDSASLSVHNNDILIFFNPDANIGYSPNSLTITADLFF